MQKRRYGTPLVGDVPVLPMMYGLGFIEKGYNTNSVLRHSIPGHRALQAAQYELSRALL